MLTRTATRRLGRSQIEVGALGMGCWAIGGPWTFLDGPGGWGAVDDDEAVRALRRAHELGVTLFDTAANYGAGHSEELLGRAFAGHRDDVVIVTKFGYDVREHEKAVAAYDGDEATGDVAARLRTDLHRSLRRLGTDHVDVYLLHVWSLELEQALAARVVLEELVAEGLIRTYGWSTDRTEAVRTFAEGPSCSVVEHELSVLGGSPEMLEVCEETDLASLNRTPLGMGLLTGKYSPQSRFAVDDVRHAMAWHPGFRGGQPDAAWLERLASVREILTSDGRTLAQGALAWLWARSPRTVPIPGFRTLAQVEENCGALDAGPLTPGQRAEIEAILGDTAVTR